MDWWSTVIVPVIVSVLSLLCGSSLTCLGGNVCTCLGETVCNIWRLDENRKEVTRESNDLGRKRDSLLTRVTAEEHRGRLRTPEVAKWLSDVEAIIGDASPVQQPLSTSGCWSTDNISNCFACGKVFKKLSEVRTLNSKSFSEVTERAPPPMVVMKPVEPTFGLDTALAKTWKSLIEDGNRMLGIYGMGGVGKTTLLTLIYNKFVERGDYFVIWVVVSKDAKVGKIQDEMGKKLGFYDENWSTQPEREKLLDINRALKTKPRFVLLLDDLWEELSLEDMGIPAEKKEYKVVFTTRFKDVYRSMRELDGIEVECLAENDACDFFEKKAGCSRLNNGLISDIAKEIVASCHGLPLALDVIGKALSTKTTQQDWRRALSILKSVPSELNGAEKDIFEVLKLSFDHLRSKDAKLCFQYCALFPKAYSIEEDELVEYWIGEGFIDEKDGRQTAKDRAYGTIETLVEASLLLKDGQFDQKVYMHNMIRELALWISKSDGERFVVKTGAGLSKLPKGADWTTVKKMSLMNNNIKSVCCNRTFPDPSCLITLFLQKNKVIEVVGEFFVVMSTLVVLNLSRNLALTELPEEISALVALRYLNLSETGINNLPKNLKELSKLIHLDLESTPNLGSISLVSGLQELQVLKFYGSKASLKLPLLGELELLEDLETLTITVREVDVLKGFLGSELAGKTQGLYLEGIQVSGAPLAVDFGVLGSLSKREIVNCDIIESPSNQTSPPTVSTV